MGEMKSVPAVQETNKRCCYNTPKEYGLHYRITLLGGEKMKEEAIEYSGRWVEKQAIK